MLPPLANRYRCVLAVKGMVGMLEAQAQTCQQPMLESVEFQIGNMFEYDP